MVKKVGPRLHEVVISGQDAELSILRPIILTVPAHMAQSLLFNINIHPILNLSLNA